jgi:hypothetical protein
VSAIDPLEIAKRVKAQRIAAERMEQTGAQLDGSEPMAAVELDEFRTPDVIGTMLGWRAWKVPLKPDHLGQVILKSVTHGDTIWTPRQVMGAVCNKAAAKKEGHIPGETCSCGLYAAKTLPHLQSMGYHRYDPERAGCWRVAGEVELWGKVIEGTQGWRAEFGYPKVLYVPFEANHLADALSRTYGVPVKFKNLLGGDARRGS